MFYLSDFFFFLLEWGSENSPLDSQFLMEVYPWMVVKNWCFCGSLKAGISYSSTSFMLPFQISSSNLLRIASNLKWEVTLLCPSGSVTSYETQLIRVLFSASVYKNFELSNSSVSISLGFKKHQNLILWWTLECFSCEQKPNKCNRCIFLIFADRNQLAVAL